MAKKRANWKRCATSANAEVKHLADALAKSEKDRLELWRQLQRVKEQADIAYPLAEVLKVTNERLYENIVDFARAYARQQDEKATLGMVAKAPR